MEWLNEWIIKERVKYYLSKVTKYSKISKTDKE